MNGISRSLNGLTIANNEAKSVNATIENTSILAENVSVKVRRLDEARVRNPHHSIYKKKSIF